MKMSICLTLGLVLTVLTACATTGEEETLDFYEWLMIRRSAFNGAMESQDGDRILAQQRLIAANCEKHLSTLMKDLEHVETDRRLLSIFGLAFVNKSEARDGLMSLLRDSNPLVRASAAAAFGLGGHHATAVEPLAELLQDRDPRVRQGALFGLRGILRNGDDRSTLPAILARVADEAPEVRSEAYTVLAKLALPATLPVLIEKGLKDRFYVARMNAATALRELGPLAYEAIPHLIETLRDPNNSVVIACWYALRRITGADLDRSYHRWRDWYDEEKKLYVFVCSDHPKVAKDLPGACPECKKALLREIRGTTKKPSDTVAPGDYVCPNHANVRGTLEFICPKCGERTVPKKKDDEEKKEEPEKDKP